MLDNFFTDEDRNVVLLINIKNIMSRACEKQEVFRIRTTKNWSY